MGRYDDALLSVELHAPRPSSATALSATSENRGAPRRKREETPARLMPNLSIGPGRIVGGSTQHAPEWVELPLTLEITRRAARDAARFVADRW